MFGRYSSSIQLVWLGSKFQTKGRRCPALDRCPYVVRKPALTFVAESSCPMDRSDRCSGYVTDASATAAHQFRAAASEVPSRLNFAIVHSSITRYRSPPVSSWPTSHLPAPEHSRHLGHTFDDEEARPAAGFFEIRANFHYSDEFLREKGVQRGSQRGPKRVPPGFQWCPARLKNVEVWVPYFASAQTRNRSCCSARRFVYRRGNPGHRWSGLALLGCRSRVAKRFM